MGAEIEVWCWTAALQVNTELDGAVISHICGQDVSKKRVVKLSVHKKKKKEKASTSEPQARLSFVVQNVKGEKFLSQLLKAQFNTFICLVFFNQ